MYEKLNPSKRRKISKTKYQKNNNSTDPTTLLEVIQYQEPREIIFQNIDTASLLALRSTCSSFRMLIDSMEIHVVKIDLDKKYDFFKYINLNPFENRKLWHQYPPRFDLYMYGEGEAKARRFNDIIICVFKFIVSAGGANIIRNIDFINVNFMLIPYYCSLNETLSSVKTEIETFTITDCIHLEIATQLVKKCNRISFIASPLYKQNLFVAEEIIRLSPISGYIQLSFNLTAQTLLKNTFDNNSVLLVFL